MKKTIVLLSLVALSISCNLTTKSIDRKDTMSDPTTKLITFTANGELVTGTVLDYGTDDKEMKYIKSKIVVKDGRIVDKGYGFHANGKIATEYIFKNGEIDSIARFFYSDGTIGKLENYKNGIKEGVAKEFREDGTQSKEIIYKEGKIINSYDYDSNGIKILPIIERLTLLEITTGFYEYKDLNSYQVLYQPIVLMRWKNNSDNALKEQITIDGVFISKGEEWAKATDYFQGYSDSPLQPGLARQAVLQSSVGYTDYYSIGYANVSCQIFINDKLYKTVKIANKYVSSNRMQ